MISSAVTPPAEQHDVASWLLARKTSRSPHEYDRLWVDLLAHEFEGWPRDDHRI